MDLGDNQLNLLNLPGGDDDDEEEGDFVPCAFSDDEEEELEEVVFDEESMPALGGTLLCVKRLTILVNTL